MSNEKLYGPLPQKIWSSSTNLDSNSEQLNGNITFGNRTKWVMEIVNNNGVRRIDFNTKDFPDLTENDFAKKVIEILHKSSLLDDLINQEAKALIKTIWGSLINEIIL